MLEKVKFGLESGAWIFAIRKFEMLNRHPGGCPVDRYVGGV